MLVVWEPILASDVLGANRVALGRISDARAAQFWDEQHVVAREIKAQLGDRQPSCCDQAGILWDLAALYGPEGKWGDSSPIFDEGPLYRAVPALQEKLTAHP